MTLIEDRTQTHFLNSMLNNLSNTEDKSPNSFSYDLSSAAAIVFEDMLRNIFYLMSLFDVDNLEGVELEKRVFQIAGLERKKPTQATGNVIVTGSPGTIIPKGTIFLAGNVEFVTDEEVTISEDNQATVKVTAVPYGAPGDVIPQSINRTKETIQGITNVYNPEEFMNGYDEELDDDLRERYYEKLQNPPKAGNPAHYRLWATEVDGIGQAKVFRTWDGPATVRVVIIGIDRKPVDSEMVERVKTHILEESPIRYEKLTVESATTKDINISVKVKIDSAINLEDLKLAIAKNVEEYLFNISFKQNLVSQAKVGESILKTNGVNDYIELTLNNSNGNVQLTETEVPILGTVEVIKVE